MADMNNTNKFEVRRDRFEPATTTPTPRPGDLDAYEVLVREHEQMLLGYLITMVHDPAAAEDLGQQAFVQAYHKLSDLKNKGSFAPWLRTIARNLALKHMKKREREVPTDPEVVRGMEEVFRYVDAPGAGKGWPDRVQLVKECFEKMPEVLRETCKLHYMDDMKAREVAEKLSASLAAILKRLERGRSVLRQCVEKQLELEEI